MQIIAHNMLAQFTDRHLNISKRGKNKNTERLSSGYRINRSADDAAGLQISEKMRQQIRGLKRGGKNTQEGISWLQVADGAMDEIASIIQRVRELAVQASNDTNTLEDRTALNNEIKALRNELNEICLDTEFNTKDIFDNSYVTMDIEGTPSDLQIFDATYDKATREATFGGFLFHGERITWDMVNSNMVTMDPMTGKQVFNEGTYSYTDAEKRTFEVICKAGSEVPDISRKLTITADKNGISIDGEHMNWSGLRDEDGRSFSENNMHQGTWMLNYEGASVAFFIGSDIRSISDMAKAINSCRDGKVIYSWKTEYTGSKNEKAVNAQFIKNLQISNSFAQKLAVSPSLSITVRAGEDAANNEDGIWLEEADGTRINGSFKSWHELLDVKDAGGTVDVGKNPWNEGSYIKENFTYTYSDTDGVDDTLLAFDFTLSDITSADSVIDGLDGMVISGKDIITNYAARLNVTYDGHLLRASLGSSGKVTFQEELALERDFDQKELTVADNMVSYNKTNKEMEIVFNGKTSGNPAITYKGNADGMEKLLDGDLKTYLNLVARKKVSAALAGKDAQTVDLDLTSGSLIDLVGVNNITTSGYFDSMVTINTQKMEMTDGSSYFEPGRNGSVYPTAFIDFKNLYTNNLDSLAGLGFNSTCKTCDNHYSIAFVKGASGSVSAGGYDYNFRQQGRNYTLQIDVDSLKNNGVANGADLSKAIVDITSECFDFHYTQYAAEGSKLYVYDNREDFNSYDVRKATFDTAPFMAIDTNIYSVELNTDNNKKFRLEYEFNYGDIKDQIIVQMKEDSQGNYVKRSDDSYELYDPKNLEHTQPGVQRWNVEITYQGRAQQALGSLQDVINDYKEFAMDYMLGNSNIQLDARDYTYMKVNGNENNNVAVRPMFESKLVMTPYENGLHIQNSSQRNDAVVIPRFALNSVVLRLYKADVSTREKAQKTIGYADHALGIVSERRSMYGAYHNRLEHTYDANANTMENTQAAESQLRDADMAEEMVDFSKHSIMEQAAQSLLAQANQTPMGILRLLE